jgi:hypothetical protein
VEGGIFMSLYEFLQDILESEEVEMLLLEPAFTLSLEDFEEEVNE